MADMILAENHVRQWQISKKKSPVIWAQSLDMTGFFGGELGIRTLETFRSTAFRVPHLRPLGQPSKLYLHPIRFGKWGELMGRTQRFFRFRTLENLHKSRLFRVERSAKRFRFRVSPVMTTSIPLHLSALANRRRHIIISHAHPKSQAKKGLRLDLTGKFPIF